MIRFSKSRVCWAAAAANRLGPSPRPLPAKWRGEEKRRPLFPSPRSYSILTEREAGCGLGDWPPWAGKPPLFIPISLSTRGYARVFPLEIDSADFVGTFLSKNQNFCYTPSIEKSGKNACVRVLAGFGWPDDSWGVTASRSVCEKLKLVVVFMNNRNLSKASLYV